MSLHVARSDTSLAGRHSHASTNHEDISESARKSNATLCDPVFANKGKVATFSTDVTMRKLKGRSRRPDRLRQSCCDRQHGGNVVERMPRIDSLEHYCVAREQGSKRLSRRLFPDSWPFEIAGIWSLWLQTLHIRVRILYCDGACFCVASEGTIPAEARLRDRMTCSARDWTRSST